MIRYCRFIISVLVLSLSLYACAGGGKARPDSDSARNVDMTGYESVPMPEIPASLVKPEERAEFLLRHFWDKLDFSTVAVSKDSIFLEQSFSNFVSVLPLVGPDVKEAAVATMMRSATRNDSAYTFMADLAEKYLWHADSPFYSEESFLPFLSYYIANDVSRRDVAVAWKEEIAMNAPGSVAPDFSVVDTAGKSHTLYGSLSGSPVILMFYQPDCDHCHEAMEMLRGDEAFMKGIADGAFRLMPVYVGDEKSLWLDHAKTLPDSWEVMIDEHGVIDNEELYLIKATPSFYVVGPDRKILLKDASLQRLIAFLSGE